MDCLGFTIVSLLVKYLGVLLITTKFKSGNCKPLVDKIIGRIKSWRSRFLSYAGRVMLIKSIFFNIQVY